jgi:flagellar hook-basal body complex protein FliE
VSFSDSLKAMLDKVNGQQLNADGFAQKFALGDDSVNWSDVMIERQKASLSLQATVQVRNKLVSAYHAIMNM